jgi:hypothetical protein
MSTIRKTLLWMNTTIGLSGMGWKKMKTTEVVIKVESILSHPNEFGCSRDGISFRLAQKVKPSRELSMEYRFQAPQFIGVIKTQETSITASAVL